MLLRWLAGVGAGFLAACVCTVVFFVLDPDGTIYSPNMSAAVTALAAAFAGLLARMLPPPAS